MALFDPDQSFGRQFRIRKQREFQVIYAHGGKIETPFFVLYYAPGATSNHRLGVTVSKKIGKAATRNRVKRMFRETFRKNKPLSLSPLDMVLNARKRIGTAIYPEVEHAFRGALARLIGGTENDQTTDPVPSRDV